jgi:carbonic anhydrase/acetyltransferase-like protein (isoleucine patch superfamily)
MASSHDTGKLGLSVNFWRFPGENPFDSMEFDSDCLPHPDIGPGAAPQVRAASGKLSPEAAMIRSYQGRLPRIPATCYVDLSAQVIGDVTLGEHSSVWMNAVLRGDVNSIRVGSNSNVQDCAVLHGQRNLYRVEVGDWVTIGHNATVHGCVVGDAVLIGMAVTILNDCRIGEGCILAAGAVVPEHTVVPPGTLWAGVPAKLRRQVTDEDRALILEYAQNYLDYTEIYLKEPRG